MTYHGDRPAKLPTVQFCPRNSSFKPQSSWFCILTGHRNITPNNIFTLPGIPSVALIPRPAYPCSFFMPSSPLGKPHDLPCTTVQRGPKPTQALPSIQAVGTVSAGAGLTWHTRGSSKPCHASPSLSHEVTVIPPGQSAPSQALHQPCLASQLHEAAFAHPEERWPC